MRIEQWLYVIPHRLRSIFRRRAVDEELDDEMRDHIECQTTANVALGMTPGEARATALRSFGVLDRHKEEVRDARGVTAVEHLAQDARFAVRMLRKTPAFTIVAVLTLALGIGVNTAIFGIVQSVLLRPLPYAHAGRLIALFETDTHGSLVGVSKLDFQDWRRQSHSFAHIAAAGNFWVRVGGSSTAVHTAQVSPELFQVLGVAPLHGTVFTTTNQSVVVSEGYWKRVLGSADVIGKTMIVQDTARIIVGVMPAAFDYPHGAELWTPQDMIPRVKVARTIRYWSVVADLKPGVSLAVAQKEMSTIAARLASAYPTTNGGVGIKAMALGRSLTGDVRPTLLLLTAIAAMVLLLACANLASLMLVRGVTRRREMAVRTALGASRGRLHRQLLTECLLLAAAGAALALPLAIWSNRFLLSLRQVRALPLDIHVSNGLVLLIAGGITILTTLVFGMAPAARSARVDVVTTLKEAGGRGYTALGLSGGLVAGEIALATLLLVGAALTSRSLYVLKSESLGFDAEQVVVLQNSWRPQAGQGQARIELKHLLDRLRGTPGITSAAYVDNPPFTTHEVTSLLVEGEPSGAGATWRQAAPRTVSAGYFRTLGIPLKAGRDFLADDERSAPVAIINESMVRTHLAWRNPIGARVALPETDASTWAAHQRGEDVWATVIGVVGDVRDIELGVPPQPTIYFSPKQHADAAAWTVVVRSSLPPAITASRLSETVRIVQPAAKPTVTRLSDAMQQSIVAPRVRAFVLTAFAALALVLAAIGIYGVTAHVTAQRTAEIGIRMALGARSPQVLAAVLGRIAGYAGLGLAIGMVTGIAAARLISAFLYGIGPGDFGAFAAAGLIAGIIAIMAALLPARRATRIDPTQALRAE